MDQANYTPEQAGILSSLCVQALQLDSEQRANVKATTCTYQYVFVSTHSDAEPRFNELLKQWKSANRSKSLVRDLAMHPAYQQIIGLGKDALPYILRELKRELDHWFWALEAISGENPVPKSSLGDMEEMARIWLDWGREHEYVR